MAFLDNSGDIILDAVLTDTGRKRLARGDGSFRIVKFALGDDEINYGSYDGSQPEGEKDLEILQTPVLEAFTNNTSQMHSFLQTYTNNQTHLYLPTMKINDLIPGTDYNDAFNTFIVASNKDSACVLKADLGWDLSTSGVLRGYAPGTAGASWIRIDQGIDNVEVNPSTGLPSSEFYENQYLIEMDSRFGQIIDKEGSTLAVPSFIDDDQIASYYLSMNVNRNFVTDNTQNSTAADNNQVIAGARGSILQFQVQVSTNLQNNNSFFTRLGGIFDAGSSTDFYFIDSIIRVTGLTTGFRIDIPVRYVRNVDSPTGPCTG